MAYLVAQVVHIRAQLVHATVQLSQVAVAACLWCIRKYARFVGATNLDNLVKHGFTLLPRAGCWLVFCRRFPGVQALLNALRPWLRA